MVAFFKNFIKKVNEAKVTWRNTCLDDFLLLESERESKNDKRTLLCDCLSILDLAVNH